MNNYLVHENFLHITEKQSTNIQAAAYVICPVACRWRSSPRWGAHSCHVLFAAAVVRRAGTSACHLLTLRFLPVLRVLVAAACIQLQVQVPLKRLKVKWWGRQIGRLHKNFSSLAWMMLMLRSDACDWSLVSWIWSCPRSKINPRVKLTQTQQRYLTGWGADMLRVAGFAFALSFVGALATQHFALAGCNGFAAGHKNHVFTLMSDCTMTALTFHDVWLYRFDMTFYICICQVLGQTEVCGRWGSYLAPRSFLLQRANGL